MLSIGDIGQRVNYTTKAGQSIFCQCFLMEWERPRVEKEGEWSKAEAWLFMQKNGEPVGALFVNTEYDASKFIFYSFDRIKS